MAERAPQSFANHRRWDPPYHFFVAVVAAISFLYAVWTLIRNPSWAAAGCAVWSTAYGIFVLEMRAYSLKVQDRVIRLEERLRLAALLPPPLKARIEELTGRQLVGLRFASDGEVAELVAAALDEKLSGEEIKKRIKSWRPDHFRV